MSSIEVLYELRKCADVIIASPAEILGAGMDYTTFDEMFAFDNINSTQILNSFASKYSSSSYTLMYCETSELDNLAKLNKELILKYDVKSKLDGLRASIPTYCPYTSSFVYDYIYLMKNIGMSNDDLSKLMTQFNKTVPSYVKSKKMHDIISLDNTDGV